MTLPRNVKTYLEKGHVSSSSDHKAKKETKAAPKRGSPSRFEEGDMVSMLDHSKLSLEGKVIAEWKGPYIIE